MKDCGNKGEERKRDGGRKERRREKEGREERVTNRGGGGREGEGEGGTGDSKLWKVLCLQLLRNVAADFRDP